MYQAGGTIRSLLDKVAEQEYLLPAIQREEPHYNPQAA
ncbi:hypothetical protein HMPREF1311_03064 [Proteus mirabilis WGLW6]|uniref:Uncharacterized protein n=1 Tax=Proteus mirabilis TaxID=584 RepID=A0A6N0USQ5_PROMI|nr:hypothetical protein HMPREF1311_03064 [Proteus mirabilis WGLW6]QKR72249.1 hypothetical protein [Proteus mirabilis]WAB22040.1 hypothetical protein [Proteus mirabilis]